MGDIYHPQMVGLLALPNDIISIQELATIYLLILSWLSMNDHYCFPHQLSIYVSHNQMWNWSYHHYTLVNSHGHWKSPFMVDLPIKFCDFPSFFVCWQEGILGWSQRQVDSHHPDWRCWTICICLGAWPVSASSRGHGTWYNQSRRPR